MAPDTLVLGAFFCFCFLPQRAQRAQRRGEIGGREMKERNKKDPLRLLRRHLPRKPGGGEKMKLLYESGAVRQGLRVELVEGAALFLVV